jgi:GH24 family phage-related lysozyme (muramidase)
MAASKSRKEQVRHPLVTDKGIQLIKTYTTPRTDTGMGIFMSYKDYGESHWRIGYGSKRLGKRPVGGYDKATKKQVDEQLLVDLNEFAEQVAQYIFVNLNENQRGALFSFAHSLGLCSFKSCRLLSLINSHASKNEIIKEWSPYINRIWFSAGERFVNRRRSELNLYLAGDKEIPTFTPHKCELKRCLLNLPATYNGAPNQLKAISYLERKINDWDPSGETMRRFFRYWDEIPGGLGSPPRPGSTY